MNAKEWLARIGKTADYIKKKEALCEQLRSREQKLTQTMNPVAVMGGGSNKTYGDVTDERIDLENEIEREKARLAAMQREAGALLEMLEKQSHYDVLYRMYILFESIEQIAFEKGRTYRSVCYLHGRALQAFQKVLDKQET